MRKVPILGLLLLSALSAQGCATLRQGAVVTNRMGPANPFMMVHAGATMLEAFDQASGCHLGLTEMWGDKITRHADPACKK